MYKSRYIYYVIFLLLLSCQSTEPILPASWNLVDSEIIFTNPPVEGQVIDTIAIEGLEVELTYFWTDPEFASSLAISSDDRTVSIVDESAFAALSDTCISSLLVATDGERRDSATYRLCFQYDISTPINFAPVYRVRIDENPRVGDTLLSLQLPGNQLTFSLGGASWTNEAISIEQDGLIKVKDSSYFDFEEAEKLSFDIRIFQNQSTLGRTELIVNLNQRVDEPQPIIWQGEPLYFEKESGTDPFLEAHQDRISDSLWISRRNDGGALLNVYSESAPDNLSPEGTLWALGTIDQLRDLSFVPLRTAINPRELPGTDMIMYIKHLSAYVPITFLTWDNGGKQGSSGGFSYRRSTIAD